MVLEPMLTPKIISQIKPKIKRIKFEQFIEYFLIDIKIIIDIRLGGEQSKIENRFKEISKFTTENRKIKYNKFFDNLLK